MTDTPKKSIRRTLEELKVQIDNSEILFVDQQGRLITNQTPVEVKGENSGTPNSQQPVKLKPFRWF
jgi:hypothetical protein